MRTLIPLLIPLLSACTTNPEAPAVDWPKLAECAPPAPDVMDAVRGVLAAEPDQRLPELEKLALKHGPGLVFCAVRTFASAPGVESAGGVRDAARAALSQIEKS